MAKVHEVLG